MPRLLFESPFMRKEYYLSGEVTVGRLADNTLTIPDYEIFTTMSREVQQEHYKTLVKVSRRHANLVCLPAASSVTDVGNKGTGSSYGTFVNHERLMPQHPHPLQDGDTLMFGFVEAVFKEV
jgi:pSer/pThr/pTyr-binding forkhead associated (FHA) protein